MPTPDSDQPEPSKMKKLISGNTDDSVIPKMPRANGTYPNAVPVSVAPTPREPRFKFLPAFWTIASVLSLIVNIVLIVILLILFQMLGAIQSTADDQVSGLLGGLYNNFVLMDQAHIRTKIDVEKQIPVNFDLTVNGSTDVVLRERVTISGVRVTVSTGGLIITDANGTITLPEGTLLPVNISNLTVPVRQQVLADLEVPVDIALRDTDLHVPFLGLQNVVRPWYCLVEPRAMFKDSPVCPSIANPAPAQPVVP